MAEEWLYLTPSAASENSTEPLLQSTAVESIDASAPATEQSGVEIPQSTAGLATEQAEESAPRSIPIIEVAFNNGMWWSMPKKLSAWLHEQFEAGNDAIYTWNFGGKRKGGLKIDGEDTSINRYKVDFVNMHQTQIDNGRMRTIRVIWVYEEDTEPQWTGQIPRKK